MAIHFHEEDLPSANLFAADAAIAVDTEAMGLVPGRDRLCLVQLSDGSGDEHLVRFARIWRRASGAVRTRQRFRGT